MKVATIQINSGSDINKNKAELNQLLYEAKTVGAVLALLPENALFMSDRQENSKNIAENLGAGKYQSYLSELSKKLGMWIVLGALPIIDQGLIYQTCLVYDDKGNLVNYYHKRHLFNVTLPDSTESYNESKAYNYGKNYALVDTPVGRIGLSICYDLRFPEHFRELVSRGAEILLIPAAFTYQTGKAHWHTLLCARAIENQCFVIASAQTGIHPDNRKTWGHSMIIDPWGNVLSRLTDEVGFCTSMIDLAVLRKQRASFPALKHRRDT